MKRLVKEALRRVGLLAVVFRLSEIIRTAWFSIRNPQARQRLKKGPDGLPLPPLKQMMFVAGTPEVNWFLEGGRLAAQSVRETLEKNGLALEAFSAVLDFGCGCGRVLRHWRNIQGPQWRGADYNAEMIRWCQHNLSFAQFAINPLDPPLPYPAATFDFVYALSVFTHMPEALQHAWMAELGRVLKPGGYLLITTHGERFLGTLTSSEKAQFHAGQLVVTDAEAAGTNLCGAYHPERYVRERLAAGFDVVDVIPAGAKGHAGQDIYLLRRKA